MEQIEYLNGANLGDRPAQIPSLSSRLTHVLPSTHISTTQHQKEPRFQYAPSPEQHHLNTQSAPPLDSHGQHNISSSSIRSPHQSSFKTLQSSSSSVQKLQQPAQIHSSLPHTMQTHCPVPAASPIQYPPTTPLESRYDQNLQANHSQMTFGAIACLSRPAVLCITLIPLLVIITNPHTIIFPLHDLSLDLVFHQSVFLFFNKRMVYLTITLQSIPFHFMIRQSLSSKHAIFYLTPAHNASNRHRRVCCTVCVTV